MSFDRSQGRCSFCGRHASEVHQMVIGPGAASICNECVTLCAEILHDDTPFSEQALELASRSPVVMSIPRLLESGAATETTGPRRSITIELEQKQQGMVLMLRELQLFAEYFELHYLWIRPPLAGGFAFVPRLIFMAEDDNGTQWMGDRGGILLARPELAGDPQQAIYAGSARFRPAIGNSARTLHVRAADPLGQFQQPPLKPWEFEITLSLL
jgi:hypothetical protein